MRTIGILGLTSLLSAAVLPMAADAQTSRYHHRVYHGRDSRYYRNCSGGNGAVGTIGGGVGGAVLGGALGTHGLGTVAAGAGGALLGRHFDQVNSRHREGCERR